MADIKTVRVEQYDKDLRGCVNINHNKYYVKGTIVDELVENGKKNGSVSLKEILEVVLEDSEEFEEIKKALVAEGFSIIG